MNKRVVLVIKVVVLLAVVGLVGWKLRAAWQDVTSKAVSIDWRFGGLGVLGFAGSMITSGLVWRWLAWRMGDRSPTLPLLGAYTFSQTGKYIPGKVALLLMRIERAGRFGMSPGVCTLSTILENALYMVSGGLVGMVAILRVTDGVEPGRRALVWVATGTAVAVLAAACHPRVFYGLVNRLLKKMNKPQVPAKRQLRAGVLAAAVAGFVPCWLFGGFALWAAGRCVADLPVWGTEWFAGAFALSVIIGMASLMPGGFLVRETVLGAAVVFQLKQAGVEPARAVILGTVAAGLQRLFQLVAEVVLGVVGVIVTGAGTREGKGSEAAPGGGI
jgi:uncharacterized membrane protein YbhN (UPF0104 family)